MPSLNIALIILIAVTTLSLVLSVAAWFFLSNIGSKLNLLERETYKRSLEFDTLKKEHLSTNHSSIGASVIEDTDSSMSTESIPHQTSIEDTIQIFRNVRGTFEDPDAKPSESINEPPHAHAPENQLIENVTPPPHTMQSQDSNSPFIPPPPPTTFDEIGVLQDHPSPDAPNSNRDTAPQTMVVMLYSEITKDADFQTLWKKISAILQNQLSPQISIDLSNINFLYEKEMDYLDKINYLISNQGGSLTLVNCEKDLLTLLNRKQQLEAIVKI